MGMPPTHLSTAPSSLLQLLGPSCHRSGDGEGWTHHQKGKSEAEPLIFLEVTFALGLVWHGAWSRSCLQAIPWRWYTLETMNLQKMTAEAGVYGLGKVAMRNNITREPSGHSDLL